MVEKYSNNEQKFKTPIYLDYQATTPLDPLVLEAMMPYFKEEFGNAHSISHDYGARASDAMEHARAEVANFINAKPKEIYFTSGATESNNLALKGLMEYAAKDGKDHLIVSSVEHKCILASAHYLKSKGYKVTILPVETNGLISLSKLEDAIKDNTALVSLIAVNNEIGVIQPLSKIGQLCKRKGVFFHTDAAQALGKIDIDVKEMGIDLMSISGHKMYGPKGIGALYLNHSPRVRVIPQIHGGGQERGIRSGTMPVPLCVGLGKACSILTSRMHADNIKIKELSEFFYNKLKEALPKIYLNGDMVARVPHNLNISFAGVEGESLMLGLSDVAAVSTGSACSSASLEGSYVLKSMKIEEELAHTSIRFGFGRYNTFDEIDYVANKLIEVVRKLRDMSPLWEMMEQGIDLKSIQWSE